MSRDNRDPELMEHDKVRDLLIDARRELTDSRSRAEAWEKSYLAANETIIAWQSKHHKAVLLAEQVNEEAQRSHDQLEAATSRIALLEQDLQTARSRAERVEQQLPGLICEMMDNSALWVVEAGQPDAGNGTVGEIIEARIAKRLAALLTPSTP